MRDDGSGTRRGRSHEETMRLLPWYVNGSLPAAERAAFEAHLAVCLRCRAEVAREAGLAAALREAGETAPSPHPAQLARLVARLDEPEAVEPRRPARDAADFLRSLAAGTPHPVRWALAAQLLLVVLLAAALDWRPEPATAPGADVPPASFQTLSDPPAAAASPAGLRLRVVFAEETSERDLRALLHAVGARVVDGPSPLGVYTLEVPSGPAADPLEVVLQHLGSHPHVRFAAPAAGSAPGSEDP